MTDVEIVRLGFDEATALATLLAEHTQEIRGGEPPRPDRYWAERLLGESHLDLISAAIDGELVGVAVIHALPDCLSGRETGLLETLYVRRDRRGRGAGRALIDAVAAEGRRRAWSRVRWIVDDHAGPSSLPERLARPMADRAYVVPLAHA